MRGAKIIMKYYKDTNSVVYAYDDEQLAHVSRLTELEVLLQEKEPTFINASKNLEYAILDLNNAKARLLELTSNFQSNDEDITIENDEEIQRATRLVEDCESKLDEASISFAQIESEYKPLKDEFDTTLPVFFDIREHLKVLKKMTAKEVDAHLNPPIPKGQLIAEAEQQKQSLLAEASTAIAPLQYAENLGIATAEESASLVDWQKYCVYLTRVDTSLAPDIEWPKKP